MTLRQYIDPAAIEAITGVVNVDDKMINAAESAIDALASDIMDQMYTYNLPAFLGDMEFSSSEAVFGVNTLTLPAQSYQVNELQFTVVELLQDSGNFKRGQRFPVASSTGSVLRFATDSGIVAGINSPVKITQVGVFPRKMDVGNYGKSIPHQLIEAVAWQVAYLCSLGCNVVEAVQNADQKGKMKSESIGTSYAYTLSDKDMSKDSVCPTSINLLNQLL